MASPPPHDRSSAASKRLTVLISGSGSNLQALIDACNTPALPASIITHVISDRKDAYGLKRAQSKDIPTTYHGVLPYKKRYPDDSGDGTFARAREAYDADLAKTVLQGPPFSAAGSSDAAPPDLVVCAGFMRIVTPSFLDPLRGANVPIINLHPSLHGDLIGANCIERAWEEFEQGRRTATGAMIHHVIADVDMGEPVVQRKVEMTGCKDLEELKSRVHETEHGLIVEGTKRVLRGDENKDG